MSTDGSKVRAASIIIALMLDSARTSETSVDIQLRIRQYIPEYSELQTNRLILQFLTLECSGRERMNEKWWMDGERIGKQTDRQTDRQTGK
jgi:hypothetical protein